MGWTERSTGIQGTSRTSLKRTIKLTKAGIMQKGEFPTAVCCKPADLTGQKLMTISTLSLWGANTTSCITVSKLEHLHEVLNEPFIRGCTNEEPEKACAADLQRWRGMPAWHVNPYFTPGETERVCLQHHAVQKNWRWYRSWGKFPTGWATKQSYVLIPNRYSDRELTAVFRFMARQQAKAGRV